MILPRHRRSGGAMGTGPVAANLVAPAKDTADDREIVDHLGIAMRIAIDAEEDGRSRRLTDLGSS